MNGLIAFNSSNDVVYQKFNAPLAENLHKIAVQHGLLAADSSSVAAAALDGNIILQIFSPVINSQRIMHCQFDNTYSSFQCDNQLNLVFGDFLGCSFIKIGQHPVEQLKRHMGIAIALARHLYGPNLFAGPAASVQEELLTECLECYEEHLWLEEQAIMLEALPRLLINSELKRAVRSTLELALERLRELGHQRAHVLMFVAHKFVGSSSTKQALALCSSDLLFLALLARSLQRATAQLSRSVAVFLEGVSHDPNSGCVPCIAHLSQLQRGTVLVQIIEYAHLPVASSIYDTFFVLQKIVSVHMQGDTDALKPVYENLESFVRQTFDSLKKAKLRGDDLDLVLKKFTGKWENLRKMYGEYMRGFERELLVRIESNLPPFIEELRQLFTITCCDSAALVSLDQLPNVSAVVEGNCLEFAEFLTVKAERNISIEAYLEDFPGLVHFIYVNRSSGLMIAPDLRSSSGPAAANSHLVPKERLWTMVEFARNYLRKGQTTVMWKDRTFHYSYFLWFEDQSSGSMKAVDLQQLHSANTFKPQCEPGLMGGDYYQQLTESCFPKAAPGKIKCYELFCIHLGLVTGTCAVEHSRRLVATIADVIGEESV